MMEHLSTPDVPEMLKYDYQETQTVWKTRMETEDKAFSKSRPALHQAILESIAISKDAACSNCYSVGSTFVNCRTCRLRLCCDCDKVVHLRRVTCRRTCMFKSFIHQMMPTEFLSSEECLETMSI